MASRTRNLGKVVSGNLTLPFNHDSDGTVMTMRSNDGVVGSISVSSDGTTYHTTSSSGAKLGPTYLQIPSLSTTERDNLSGVTDGFLIYNSTLGYFQNRVNGGWASIASPPSISNVNPSSFDGSSGTTFTINGSGFDSGATVKFVGADNTQYTAATVTFVNSSQLTATTPQNLTVDNEPYAVLVTNSSGLGNTYSNAIDAGGSPSWSTSSGSLGTILNAARAGNSYTVAATDPDGQTVSYSIVSGNVPTGMSFNTSTGVINGTPDAVSSDTTYTFTVRASDGINTSDREFSITVQGPVVVTLTSGSGNWSVPSGITSIRALVIAGGGGAGGNTGGGAGGLVDVPAMPVTPGGTVAYSIGGAGSPNGVSQNGWPAGSGGGNTVFGGITAVGGGGGGGQGGQSGFSGGSGGGGGGTGGGGTGGGGGSGTQGPSGGFTGYGNPGGSGSGTSQANPDGGGGGGGAGGAGRPAWYTSPSNEKGWGGIGFTSDITGSPVGYAGGGQGTPAANQQPTTYGSRAGATANVPRPGSGVGGSRGGPGGSSTASTGAVIIQY